MGGINTTKTKADYDCEIKECEKAINRAKENIERCKWDLAKGYSYPHVMKSCIADNKAAIAREKERIKVLKEKRKNAPKG